jgi:choline monooxygenase
MAEGHPRGRRFKSRARHLSRFKSSSIQSLAIRNQNRTQGELNRDAAARIANCSIARRQAILFASDSAPDATMTFRPRADLLQAQPLERAHALAAAFYTDPAALAGEQRHTFSRHWQLLAHVSQLAGAGDHVVGEIAGVPVLVVRDDDGQLHAMHNVCRHRAGPLALCDGRGARALRCRYHGWTYTLAGQLRSAPEMAEAEDFDIGTIRLPTAQLALWRGLVFVALEPAIALEELLEGIDARLGALDFSGYVFAWRDSFEVACNWKVYVDNYLEGYHVPHIHPELNRMLDYRSYVTTTARWHSLQFSPLESDPALYGEGEALYYYLWPNLMLNILPGRLQTNRVIPLGPDRCRVEFDYCYPDAAQADAARREADRRFSAEVQAEDADICAQVQRRLASGVYEPGRLNPKRENAVHHFHELVRRSWRDP